MSETLDHLLPGCLPASFRGVDFFVPDARTQAGRRVAEHLFPGVDLAAYDDFGLHPADMRVEGLMVGDDYIGQAKALQSAFETAGTGTLVHPWLGVLTVILVEPGEISFSAKELRVARFSATFRVIRPAASFGGGTTVALFSAVAAMLSAVSGLAEAPARAISQISVAAAKQSARIARDAWAAAPAGRAAAAVRTVFPADLPATAQAFAAEIVLPAQAAIALIPALNGEPAVAPAAEIETGSTVLAFPAADLTPRAGAALLLDTGRRILAALPDAPSQTDAAMLIAAAGDPIARAAGLTAYVDFASRDDALSTRADLTALFDAISDRLDAIDDAVLQAAASEAGRALLALRAKTIADINETIGRLPELVIFETQTDTDAFQIANHLYGDRPETIEAGYRSIVARNRPRHPAMLPAGRIEALK